MEKYTSFFTRLALAFFCFVPLASIAQIAADTLHPATGIDTGSVINKLNSLNSKVVTVDSLKEKSTLLQKENADYIKAIEDLQKIKSKTEESKRQLRSVENKLKQNTDSLKSIDRKLIIERGNYEKTIAELASEVKRIDSIRSNYLKDTLQLSKKKDTLSKDTSSLNKQKKDFAAEIDKQKSIISKQLDSLNIPVAFEKMLAPYLSY